MTTFQRFARFSGVGLLGTALQLLTLAALTRAFPTHYLLASAVALELTLLHNFLWHLRYTWPDRTRTQIPQACLRFHLTNGLISLVGNLTLIGILVHHAHLPPVLANLIAIAVCSIANFHLSHRWTFQPTHTHQEKCLPKNGATLQPSKSHLNPMQ